MYGALWGDMMGTLFQFCKGHKDSLWFARSKRFGFEYADGSFMSLAIAKAVMDVGLYADEAVMKAMFVDCLQDFGNRYARGKYYDWYAEWFSSANPWSHGICANRSAMRVASIGWFYESIERTREVARWTAEVTNNHPEDIKGAEAVASAIYLARNGASKDEIKQYVIDNFGYDLSRTCDEIRPIYQYMVSGQETVPEAITAFLEGEDFKDVICTAVSFGGGNALPCIAGSIAEAFYGIPEDLKEEWDMRILPKEFLDILSDFKEYALYNGGERGKAAQVDMAVWNSSKNPYTPRMCSPYRFTAEDRINVFRDTMDWIENDPDLSAAVALATQKTTVFYEEDYPAFDASESKDAIITVAKDRSFQAAMRLHRENPEAKIAVVNFADAFHAGGKVMTGLKGQEESMCRTSTLYPLLYRKTLRDSFYKHHYDMNTPKASDALIYTEGVVICKTDEDLPKRMPKEDWVTVDVITVAAPYQRRRFKMLDPSANGRVYGCDAELFGYCVKRAIHMLTCAAAKSVWKLPLPRDCWARRWATSPRFKCRRAPFNSK